ncbi:hypothetical protein [Mycobacterium sp.]|uniref:hypothetical protein n=1 Tax=Mycobacterium sp. TaxID=1785 RepID=UPI003BAC2C3A
MATRPVNSYPPELRERVIRMFGEVRCQRRLASVAAVAERLDVCPHRARSATASLRAADHLPHWSTPDRIDIEEIDHVPALIASLAV